MAQIDARVHQRVLAMLKVTGTNVTYRPVSVSEGFAADQNPPSLSSVAVSGVTTVGSGSITLTGSGWFGKLVAGDSIVVAGHTDPYVIQADQTIAANAVTVSVLPVVEIEIPDATEVTLSFSVDVTVLARVSSKPFFYRGGTLVEESRLSVIFKGDALPSRPKQGDIIIFDSNQYRVASVNPDYIKETVGLWRVQAE